MLEENYSSSLSFPTTLFLPLHGKKALDSDNHCYIGWPMNSNGVLYGIVYGLWNKRTKCTNEDNINQWMWENKMVPFTCNQYMYLPETMTKTVNGSMMNRVIRFLEDCPIPASVPDPSIRRLFSQLKPEKDRLLQGQQDVVDLRSESGVLGWMPRCNTLDHLRFKGTQIRKVFGTGCKPVACCLVMDGILGIWITMYLVSSLPFWMTLVVDQTDRFISKLEHVVQELIWMPAGLKLNRPLNVALGHFFFYHIYLLRTYMSLLSPVYGSIGGAFLCFGLMGLSTLLSLVADLFSLATIHVYCFYGYAAKIYSFQVHALFSLFRLFRGKKLNQLRNRVDSYTYQTDQLFIGSIGFTILFFLLPTTLLYYSVFLVLRLSCIFTLSVLTRTIRTLSTLSLLFPSSWWRPSYSPQQEVEDISTSLHHPMCHPLSSSSLPNLIRSILWGEMVH